MKRQGDNQGRTLPKTEPVKVSAVGKRVARFRHWCKGHWPVIEGALWTVFFLTTGYVTLVLVIGLAPVNH